MESRIEHPELAARALGCPVDHSPLEAIPGAVICARGHRYALHARAGRAFADFSAAADLDTTAALQRETYESTDSRYLKEGQENKAAFMRRFVERRVEDRVKSKEALLLSTFRSLGLSASSRLLEVGCNDGRYLAVATAICGGSGIGVDLSMAAIEQALDASEAEPRNVFHVGLADRLPVQTESIDCVLSFDVFEHLGQEGFAAAMSEAARVLRPGGVLLVYIVSQLDRFTLHETLRQVSGGRIGVDDGEGHRWENFIHPDHFRDVARARGLEVTCLRAYHGFWTLFAEYYLFNAPPRWAYRILGALDYPLVRFEHGNGFLAVARKENP